MSQPSSTALGAYNPAQVSKTVLLAEYGGRAERVEELLAGLGGPTKRQPCQHALVVGSSGSGKTTLLHVLTHKVEEAWIPLLFDEENYHIGDLAGFWLECLRLLEHSLGRVGEVTHEALRASRASNLEKQAREAFLKLLGTTKRRALLLVDRLDELLASIRDEDSHKRLRTFLAAQGDVCMIATAAAPLDESTVRDRAFPKLFQLHHLKGFTVEEMKMAARSMTDARGGSARHLRLPAREGFWRGLHILTDGNPRLLKMTWQLMDSGVAPDFHALLMGLLDACTPDFKQRIEGMSRQQQRVFDAIACAWDSVQIADISPGLRMESNQISAQIQALVEARLVAVIGGTEKRKRYQVADRLANLYCLMRFSRADRSRLEWFIRTMNILLEPDPHAQPLEKLRELSSARPIAGGGQDEGKLHAQLLEQAMRTPEEELFLPDEGRKSARHLLKTEQGNASGARPSDALDMDDLFPVEFDVVRYATNLPAEQRNKLGYQHTSSQWWCLVAGEAWKLNKTTVVDQCARKAVELSAKNAPAWGMLSALLLQRKRAPEALDAAQKLLKHATDEVQRELAQALILAARRLTPEHREDAGRMALQMAMQAPGELFSILGFWCHLRCDVKACREMLPPALVALNATSSSDDSRRTLTHFLALGVSQTLLAADLDDEVLAAVEAADAEARQALDTPVQAIMLRKDESLRAFLAPERLALADVYLSGVARRKTEMQRAIKSAS